MVNNRSGYAKPTMKYSDYIKLLDYLSQVCKDKEYHSAVSKLDKFKIIIED